MQEEINHIGYTFHAWSSSRREISSITPPSLSSGPHMHLKYHWPRRSPVAHEPREPREDEQRSKDDDRHDPHVLVDPALVDRQAGICGNHKDIRVRHCRQGVALNEKDKH